MESAWHVVGAAIRARREELGLSQKAAAEAGGLSEPTWSTIERSASDSYRRQTVVGVCRALGWTLDSIDRLLAGEEPRLAGEVVRGSVLEAVAADSRLDDEAKGMLVTLYQRLTK